MPLRSAPAGSQARNSRPRLPLDRLAAASRAAITLLLSRPSGTLDKSAASRRLQKIRLLVFGLAIPSVAWHSRESRASGERDVAIPIVRAAACQARRRSSARCALAAQTGTVDVPARMPSPRTKQVSGNDRNSGAPRSLAQHVNRSRERVRPRTSAGWCLSAVYKASALWPLPADGPSDRRAGLAITARARADGRSASRLGSNFRAAGAQRLIGGGASA